MNFHHFFSGSHFNDLLLRIEIQWVGSQVFHGMASHSTQVAWEKHNFYIVIIVRHVLASCGAVKRLSVTLHATLYWNSNLCSPLTHVYFQDPCFISITFLFSILTLTLDSILGTPYAQPCLTFSILCLLPVYPDRGFYNPISDLLIPTMLATLHSPQ